MIRFLGVVLIVLSVGCSDSADAKKSKQKDDTPDIWCVNGVEYYFGVQTFGHNSFSFMAPKFDADTKQVSLCNVSTKVNVKIESTEEFDIEKAKDTMNKLKQVFDVMQEGEEND